MNTGGMMVAAMVLGMCGLRAAEPVKVVSFSSVLTEVAEAVGGKAVVVVGLVKPGVDPHAYEPTPGDLRELSDARLILVSGRHLEHYSDKLRAGAGADAEILGVGDRMPALALKTGGGVAGAEDPHWWHGVANVERATRIVRDALMEIDPSAGAAFQANAAAYLARLNVLEAWIKQKVAELPRDRRRLVTSHDAFQFFAKEFGFRIHAIEGVSTEKEATASQVDALIGVIQAEGVKAIFLEDTLNPKVSREITRETGARIGGTLYADGLGEGEGSTYEGMMKHNVTTIVEALK